MTGTSFGRLAALAGACVLASGGLASAEIREILGKDDPVYARRLYEGGFPEFAERLCRVILEVSNPSPGSPELLAVQALQLDLQFDVARGEPDLFKRKEAIQTVIEAKRTFIAGSSRTEVAQEMRAKLPEDYRLVGEVITSILKGGQVDPETASALRKEGVELCGQAEEALKERMERFDEQRRGGGAQAQYAERQYELALFSLGRIYYFQSLLFTPEDPERKKILEQAVDTFEEYGLEFPESLNAYVSAIYEGLCHRDAGNVRRALEAFDAAIALRETYAPLENGSFDVSPDAADIVSQAVLQKVQLHAERGEHAAADAAARDFFATIPDAWQASHARRVALHQTEALLAAQRTQDALAVAQKLVDLAADTAEGLRASEILSSSAIAVQGPDQLLKVAQDQIQREKLDVALRTCRKVLVVSRGTPEEADAGAAAYDLMGIAYLRQDRPLEAVMAFDTGAERFPAAKRAPDVLYKSMNLYFDLAGKEKRAFFRKRATDRMRQLAGQYSSHPLAIKIAIAEGKALEADDKWAEAAQVYRGVPEDSRIYAEAQYRIGLCLYKQAKASSGGDATARLEEARDTLVRARAIAAERAAKTLDEAEQRELADVAFNALMLEVQALLDGGRASETEALLAEAEQQYQGDEERRSRISSFRIRALLEQGAFDQAIERFEVVALAAPDDPSTASAAFQIAVALDNAAAQGAAGDHGETLALWSKAAAYYLASVRSQLAGKATVDFDRLDAVADRLLILGLHLNAVPEVVDTFIDWDKGEVGNPDPWENAARIYSLELAQAPSQRRQIQLGRVYGLLGRYEEAAEIYARIFDAVEVIQRDGQQVRLDPQVAKNNPELIVAFLEYAVSEHRAGMAAGEKNRLDRAAQTITEIVGAIKGFDPQTRLFWQAKHAQVTSLYDRGLYPEAKLLVGDIERTTNDFDQGRFGYKEKFLKAKQDLQKKVPR